ncbi:hypothetical protein A1OE_1502 [Candidatus Endolissoclinum faulkneri L2]|uniref:Uncharacterized protein n=1 Tax=Candidatus Endolissoclinum faulkneri L2 TaxID=1193729 RepID=K7ZDM9_9PROT|nr:hypothetical protein A1OE_1502 [Candidatus Endolissoclinum faulkneri L2]
MSMITITRSMSDSCIIKYNIDFYLNERLQWIQQSKYFKYVKNCRLIVNL